MLIPSFLVVIFLIPSASFLIVSADSLIAVENILIGITPIPRETSFFLILLIFFILRFLPPKGFALDFARFSGL